MHPYILGFALILLLSSSSFFSYAGKQLRVHCAEVLRTPIVGDYKYGWQAHRKWKQLFQSNIEKNLDENLSNRKTHPFGLDLESGSILDKQPHLHLHCKQMVLPNVSLALQNLQLSAECDLSELESLEFVAPLPSHMQRSWDILNSWATIGILQVLF